MPNTINRQNGDHNQYVIQSPYKLKAPATAEDVPQAMISNSNSKFIRSKYFVVFLTSEIISLSRVNPAKGVNWRAAKCTQISQGSVFRWADEFYVQVGARAHSGLHKRKDQQELRNRKVHWTSVDEPADTTDFQLVVVNSESCYSC